MDGMFGESLSPPMTTKTRAMDIQYIIGVHMLQRHFSLAEIIVIVPFRIFERIIIIAYMTVIGNIHWLRPWRLCAQEC